MLEEIDFGLLNEVDHPCIGIGHFPVWWQRFQILISHHIISKIHRTVGLVVTRDRLHPVRWLRKPFSGFCCSKHNSLRIGKVMLSSNSSLHSNYIPGVYCKFPSLLCLQCVIIFETINRHIYFLFSTAKWQYLWCLSGKEAKISSKLIQ